MSVVESKVVSEEQARLLSTAMRKTEIAEAVSQRLAQTGQATAWPLWQKIGALVGGILVVADSLRGLIA